MSKWTLLPSCSTSVPVILRWLVVSEFSTLLLVPFGLTLPLVLVTPMVMWASGLSIVRRLQVNSETAIVSLFKSTTQTNSSIAFQDVNSTTGSSVRVGSVGDDFWVVAGSAEQIRVKPDGRVGMGTPTPQHTLDIGGYRGYEYPTSTRALMITL